MVLMVSRKQLTIHFFLLLFALLCPEGNLLRPKMVPGLSGISIV